MTILTQFYTLFTALLAFLATHESGMQYVGAGIAVFTGFGSGIGEGMVAAKACEAIGRQPEASGKITVTMVLGQAIAETTGLYGLVIAIMCVSK